MTDASNASSPPRSAMQRNLRLLPWWWVFRWAWLGEGIWVLYLTRERGLTLGQVLLFEAVFAAVVVLGEVPTGMLADRFGRRASLILGSVIVILGFLAFGLSPFIGVLLLAYALFGFSETLFSGADSAMLFDSLKGEGREDEFTAWNGRLNALLLGAIAAWTVIGSVMVRWTPLTTPILLSAALSLPAIVLAWRMHEPPRDDERHSYLQTGRLALSGVARSVALRSVIVLMALTTFSIALVGVTQQIMVVNAGMPLWSVGLFVALQMALAAFGSAVADRFGRWLTLRRTFLLMPLLSTLALLAVIPGSIWLYPLFIFPAFGWNVMWPHFADYLSRRAPDSLRATTISVASVVASAGSILVTPVVGLGVDRLGMATALTLTSLVYATAVLVAYLAWRRAGDLLARPNGVPA
ncbi:MAG: hypothetical protein CVU47_10295 [Chloroflexi bacterium HGW-Chloroflexi-9]|nr:MAG: hypothetical protein CVU47_10295 [Chloroflexi bacterium HGW-Chloroflexi-9]